MTYNKDLIIITEGTDGSGKTTIQDALLEKYPDLNVMRERSFISDAVYARKFGRQLYKNVPIKTYLDYWSNYYKNAGDVRVVLCTADTALLANRCIGKNDPLCEGKSRDTIIKELFKDQRLFEVYTEYYSNMFKTLTIDTGEPLTLCIHQIEEFIKDAKL